MMHCCVWVFHHRADFADRVVVGEIGAEYSTAAPKSPARQRRRVSVNAPVLQVTAEFVLTLAVVARDVAFNGVPDILGTLTDVLSTDSLLQGGA